MSCPNDEKIKKIQAIIKLAEEWCEDQTLNETLVCVSALKDIRRLVNTKPI